MTPKLGKPCNTSLAILCRYPAPGKTKTRLIPLIGAEQAAAFQTRLLKHLVYNLADQPIGNTYHYQCSLWLTGESRATCETWLIKQKFPQVNNTPIALHMQATGDLGQRMSAICKNLLNKRQQRIILIGSDIPDISSETIETAIRHLDEYPVVIGPAADGGYYLIGMNRHTYDTFHTDIFHNMPWGTDMVYQITTERLSKKPISFKTLAPMRDIDRPEDLDYGLEVINSRLAKTETSER